MEQRDRALEERQEELNELQKVNRDLSRELELLKLNTNDEQSNILELQVSMGSCINLVKLFRRSMVKPVTESHWSN